MGFNVSHGGGGNDYSIFQSLPKPVEAALIKADPTLGSQVNSKIVSPGELDAAFMKVFSQRGAMTAPLKQAMTDLSEGNGTPADSDLLLKYIGGHA